MKKQIYDEKNGMSYTLHGDYYLPDLVLREEEMCIRDRSRDFVSLSVKVDILLDQDVLLQSSNNFSITS